MQGSPLSPRINTTFKQFRLIHWGMAIGYLAVVTLGLSMTKIFRDGLPHNGMYILHSSLGVLTLAGLSFRVVYLFQISWKKYTRHLPRFSPDWLRAIVLYTLLYILMWLIPMTGIWLVNSVGSHNLAVFGLPLPDLFPENSNAIETASKLHGWLAYLLIMITLFHVIEQRKTAQLIWKKWFTKNS